MSADGTIMAASRACATCPCSFDLPPSTKRVCLTAPIPSPPALPSFQALLSSIGCAIVYAMRTAPSVSVIAMAKEFGYSGTERGQVSLSLGVCRHLVGCGSTLPNSPAAVWSLQRPVTLVQSVDDTPPSCVWRGEGVGVTDQAAAQPRWEVGATVAPLRPLSALAAEARLR